VFGKSALQVACYAYIEWLRDEKENSQHHISWGKAAQG
jgi:hypothetical protein